MLGGYLFQNSQPNVMIIIIKCENVKMQQILQEQKLFAMAKLD